MSSPRLDWRGGCFTGVKSRTVIAALVLGALLLAGIGLRPAASDRAGPGRETRGTAMGAQRLALGVLGGFRGIVADFVWLRAYVVWERRDAARTGALLNLATTLDPRPVYFWLNGARMLAYDMPVWRIESAGGFDAVPAGVQRRIAAEQAGLALALLDRGMAHHPRSAELWIERAGIELNRLHDRAAAAESYRRAWSLPGAPYFAARLHGQLLWQLGRKSEAYAWLVRLHPTLPPHDERAAADLVLERIRTLERDLKIPPDRAYRADAGK
jgi:hypothetical protein